MRSIGDDHCRHRSSRRPRRDRCEQRKGHRRSCSRTTVRATSVARVQCRSARTRARSPRATSTATSIGTLWSPNRGDSTVQVLNADDGVLVAGAIYPVGAEPSDVAIADIDGLRGLDVLAVSPTASTLTVLLNDGSGGLVAQPPLVVVGGAKTLAVGELNGLPGYDVAISRHLRPSPDPAQQRRGHSDESAPPTTGAAPADVAINDMDGVNGRDVIVRTDGGVQVFLNDGAGNLASLVPVAATGISNSRSPHSTASLAPTPSWRRRPSRSFRSSERRRRKSHRESQPHRHWLPDIVGVGNFDGG